MSLDELSYGYMSEEDWRDFLTNKPSFSDRECVVQLGAVIELTLKVLIEFRLESLPEEEKKALFVGRGKLANFANKIKEARSLKLIDVETRRDLEILKTIRNAFAHSARRLTLEANELREECLKFKGLKKIHGTEPNLESLTSRQIFDRVTDHLVDTLIETWHAEIAKRDAARIYSTKPAKADQKSGVANPNLRLVVSNDEATISRMAKQLEAATFNDREAALKKTEDAMKKREEERSRDQALKLKHRRQLERERVADESFREEIDRRDEEGEENDLAQSLREEIRKMDKDEREAKARAVKFAQWQADEEERKRVAARNDIFLKILEAFKAGQDMGVLLGQLSDEDLDLFDAVIQHTR